MSAASMNQAANDQQLQARVTAMAHKEILFNGDLADTTYGKALSSGMANIMVLMWPVAVDTEAAYESALLAGRGAPGHDADIITDAALTAAINAHWPEDDPAPTP